ncbi:MAG: pantoate kinase [Candidatus Hadarchaeota archaeon]
MLAFAFVPAHISGFFQPCVAKVPERTGSRNCGPCLDVGVLTMVKAEPAARNSLQIWIDGERVRADTTSQVVERILRLVRGHSEVAIDHICQVPVGAGYGASGAGAIGAAVALSKAVGLSLPRKELVRVAHVAEVKCRTGLGDVGAQAFGGLVIGVKPGAPPHGMWRRIPVPTDMRVICATLGPISTKSFLSSRSFLKNAEELGGKAMDKLLKQPTLKTFGSVSYEFVEGLGLLDEDLKRIIGAAEGAGAILASQAMIGRAVFAMVGEKNFPQVKRAFLKHMLPEQLIVSKVYSGKPKLLGIG